MLKIPLMFGTVMFAAAIADPVTNADLAGKKICWKDGANVAYGKDGFFYASQMGNGKWRLDGDRLTMDGVGGEYIWTINKQGQIFHLQGITVKQVYSGKYCN